MNEWVTFLLYGSQAILFFLSGVEGKRDCERPNATIYFVAGVIMAVTAYNFGRSA